MIDDTTLAIWWTGQLACKEIGEPHWRGDYWPPQDDNPPPVSTEDYHVCWLDDQPWPYYVKEQYASRYGRSGRGRLWVNKEVFGRDIRCSWDDTWPICQQIIAEDAGGIVIRRDNAALLRPCPGFFTTLGLERC